MNIPGIWILCSINAVSVAMRTWGKFPPVQHREVILFIFLYFLLCLDVGIQKQHQ